MKNNKINIVCSCKNKTAWTIYVKGGLDHTGKCKPHTYWFTCGNCDAEMQLGLEYVG